VSNRGDVRAFVIAGSIVAGGLFVILWPVFVPAKIVDGDRHGWGLVNLKVLSTGMNIYLSDSDDRFPPDTSSARAAYRYMADYLKNPNYLTGENKTSPEFLGNGSLAGKKYTESLDRTILFFDSAPTEKTRCLVLVEMTAKKADEDLFQRAVANRWVWHSLGAKP